MGFKSFTAVSVDLVKVIAPTGRFKRFRPGKAYLSPKPHPAQEAVCGVVALAFAGRNRY